MYNPPKPLIHSWGYSTIYDYHNVFAYEAGYVAALIGKSIEDNPNKTSKYTSRSLAWERGFDDYHE